MEIVLEIVEYVVCQFTIQVQAMPLLVVEIEIVELNRCGVHKHGVIQVVATTCIWNSKSGINGFGACFHPCSLDVAFALTEHVYHTAAVTRDVADDSLRPMVDKPKRDRVWVNHQSPFAFVGLYIAIYVSQQARIFDYITIDDDIFCDLVQCHGSDRIAHVGIVKQGGIQAYICLKDGFGEQAVKRSPASQAST